jgi:hypothetical protein
MDSQAHFNSRVNSQENECLVRLGSGDGKGGSDFSIPTWEDKTIHISCDFKLVHNHELCTVLMITMKSI